MPFKHGKVRSIRSLPAETTGRYGEPVKILGQGATEYEEMNDVSVILSLKKILKDALPCKRLTIPVCQIGDVGHLVTVNQPKA